MDLELPVVQVGQTLGGLGRKITIFHTLLLGVREAIDRDTIPITRIVMSCVASVKNLGLLTRPKRILSCFRGQF